MSGFLRGIIVKLGGVGALSRLIVPVFGSQDWEHAIVFPSDASAFFK
jgi:hypothetical protein